MSWTCCADLHCALLVAACKFALVEHVDKAIELLEERNGSDDRRALVSLYAAKGGSLKCSDDKARQCFEKALRLANSEFDGIHSDMADTHGNFARTLFSSHLEKSDSAQLLAESAQHFRKELEIREALYGADHPCTLQSVDWNVRVLKKLSRHEEIGALVNKFAMPYGLRFPIRNAADQPSHRRLQKA